MVRIIMQTQSKSHAIEVTHERLQYITNGIFDETIESLKVCVESDQVHVSLDLLRHICEYILNPNRQQRRD
jgi:hypothetical protein